MRMCTFAPRTAAPSLPLAAGLTGWALWGALLVGGCAEPDKLGGQDGEEASGADDASGGTDDDGGSADGDAGGEGADGDTGQADPPDRVGRGTRSYAEGDSTIPGERSCLISWQGTLGPASSGCVDCAYDFSVSWTVTSADGDCSRAAADETEVYAFDLNYRGEGPTVLILGDDGRMGPLSPAFETATSIQWGVGPLDEPTDGAGGLRYLTQREEASIAFSD